MNWVLIADESLRALFIEMVWEDKLLACGTGFYYVCDNSHFLITVWHNLSGRNSESGEYLSSRSVEPMTVRVHERSLAARTESSIEMHEYRVVDDSGRPLWLEHPRYGLDMVALPVDFNSVHLYTPWEVEDPAMYRNRLWVTEEVAIVGYPYGLKGGSELPLWVRGTIASEPHIPFRDRPVFLVDSRTRTGQSGSPVLLFYRPGTQVPRHEPNGYGYRYEPKPVSRLIGVYSGRISIESDLGYVWTVEALNEICREGVRGSYDPPLKSMTK
ncbi:trypsin-like peptidase domain-containing protein [Nocardia beijingensis]|uniref:trypsin-like peptidase domain-containing protein n=1 Tax=Nocardia beijingensis TaxID=95162 RepID=UPI001893C5FA|nr:trypsin-like peptidase domain-containing protein [Nocardia beijingensis]MBF6469976.1 trypsin-like peptidase domain-containing protein [Nocardia beijingensis]